MNGARPVREELPESEPDFAEEHQDLTVCDRERGGPEGVPENESPKGYGGTDYRFGWLLRRR